MSFCEANGQTGRRHKVWAQGVVSQDGGQRAGGEGRGGGVVGEQVARQSGKGRLRGSREEKTPVIILILCTGGWRGRGVIFES